MENNLGVIVAALLGTGGLGATIALFVVPASKKWDGAETRLGRLESEVAALKNDLRFLTAGITALSYHCDGLRLKVLYHEPVPEIQTSSEILAHVRTNIDQLTGE